TIFAKSVFMTTEMRKCQTLFHVGDRLVPVLRFSRQKFVVCLHGELGFTSIVFGFSQPEQCLSIAVSINQLLVQLDGVVTQSLQVVGLRQPLSYVRRIWVPLKHLFVALNGIVIAAARGESHTQIHVRPRIRRFAISRSYQLFQPIVNLSMLKESNP